MTASQLLAHIFRVATGQDIEEYAARHLFARSASSSSTGSARRPACPSGIGDTEGGLYLRAHDLAKIAYLFAEKRRLGRQTDYRRRLPSKLAVTPSVKVGGGGVQYGLKWWLYPYGDGSRLA